MYVVEDRVMRRGEHLGSWVVIRQGPISTNVLVALLFTIKPGSMWLSRALGELDALVSCGLVLHSALVRSGVLVQAQGPSCSQLASNQTQSRRRNMDISMH